MAEIARKPAAKSVLRCARGDCQRPLIYPPFSVRDLVRGWLHYCFGCQPA